MSDKKRQTQAAKIINTPQEYKVCEGCDSIVKSAALFCPSCHGYRFDEAPLRVVEQARILSSRERTSVLASDLE